MTLFATKFVYRPAIRSSVLQKVTATRCAVVGMGLLIKANTKELFGDIDFSQHYTPWYCISDC